MFSARLVDERAFGERTPFPSYGIGKSKSTACYSIIGSPAPPVAAKWTSTRLLSGHPARLLLPQHRRSPRLDRLPHPHNNAISLYLLEDPTILNHLSISGPIREDEQRSGDPRKMYIYTMRGPPPHPVFKSDWCLGCATACVLLKYWLNKKTINAKSSGSATFQ